MVQEMMKCLPCILNYKLQNTRKSVPGSPWVIDLLQLREQRLPFYRDEKHAPLMT